VSRVTQKEIAELAVSKGWPSTMDDIDVPEMVALAHSELSEALECFRDPQMNYDEIYTDGEDSKPEGVVVEFADCVIRLYHYAELLGFDLDEVIAKKHEYNKKRRLRHGGKRI
jgi:hypothetical protein